MGDRIMTWISELKLSLKGKRILAIAICKNLIQEFNISIEEIGEAESMFEEND